MRGIVSVALVLARLYRICGARTGVTRMAFQWRPDVPLRLRPPLADYAEAIIEGADPHYPSLDGI